jgi:hypothetical protein
MIISYIQQKQLYILTNTMCKLLSDQLVELETGSLQVLIEPDTLGVHQGCPQEAIEADSTDRVPRCA